MKNDYLCFHNFLSDIPNYGFKTSYIINKSDVFFVFINNIPLFFWFYRSFPEKIVVSKFHELCIACSHFIADQESLHFQNNYLFG